MAPVDFLVVTALEDELRAVQERLRDVAPDGQFTRGSVPRERGGEFSIGLAVTGPGSVEATRATQLALQHFVPRAVILCGIAAGFPEANVTLGDVLIPAAVVDYEFGKEAAGEDEELETEHRAFPIALSYPLHLAALNFATTWDPGTVPRPLDDDGRSRPHAGAHSLLGCGMKVIAESRAEARTWLLERFPKNVIGLEMEASGVLAACGATDTPLLVVKGVQDDATELKDDLGTKDVWRDYASNVAAEFVVALLRQFSPATQVLTVEHMRELHRIIDDQRLPAPYFDYSVSVTDRYSELVGGRFDQAAGDPTRLLMPNDDHRTIAIHAPGGRGKTRIARKLLGDLLADDDKTFPILMDLSRLTSPPPDEAPAAEHLDALLSHCSVPRRSPDELETLVTDYRVVLILDGMNEIPKTSRDVLIAFIHDLRGRGRCHVIATDRMADTPPLTGGDVLYATIDRLSDHKVRAALGDTEYEALSPELRRVLEHPFFLSLAVKRGFSPQSEGMGENFVAFFADHLKWAPPILDELASSIFGCLDRSGRLVPGCLGTAAPTFAAQLLANDVLRGDGQFDHELWRDFFIARHLAGNDDLWTRRGFDTSTAGTTAFEPLAMALEFIQPDDRVRFVKEVYNWNWLAACRCAAAATVDLGAALATAIRAAIAEKLTDPIEHTRERARALLEAMDDEFAQMMLKTDSRQDVVDAVRAKVLDEDWYTEWQELFCRPDDEAVTDSDVESIASTDSLVGWAAANTLRRSRLNADNLARLHAIYAAHHASEGEPVRWRVVHALSQQPAPDNADFLLRAFESDPAHWIQYGAARAIVEVAGLSDTAARVALLNRMVVLVGRYQTDERWKQKAILGEIVDACELRGAPDTWSADVRPLLELVIEHAEPEHKDLLRAKVERIVQRGA